MWLLFSFSTYYPGGGESDFAGKFETREAAEKAYSDQEFPDDHAQVYDVGGDEWHTI